MPVSVSQGVTVTLGGAAVAYVTQATVNETCPTVDISDLGLAENSSRQFIKGLPDAADITLNHIGSSVALGDKSGGISIGAISFAGATAMSSEVAYRVGEVEAWTTTIRASSN
jgi:hypothetical protein